MNFKINHTNEETFIHNQSTSRSTNRASNHSNLSNTSSNASNESVIALHKFRNMSLNEKRNLYVENFKQSKTRPSVAATVQNFPLDIKKKNIMSLNEKRKLNQNYVEDKLLLIARKDLDKQLTYSQLLIKREKSILLDQLMETKAVNATNVKSKSAVFSASSTLPTRIRTAITYKDSSLKSIEVEPGHQNVNVFDKFVDQKRRNFPGYLKHSNALKYSLPIYDIDQVIGR